MPKKIGPKVTKDEKFGNIKPLRALAEMLDNTGAESTVLLSGQKQPMRTATDAQIWQAIRQSLNMHAPKAI